MRKNAAESLGFFYSAGEKAVPKLLDVLGDQNVEVRRAAIQSLGRLRKGGPEVVAALNGFTKDPDALIRTNAVVALAAMGQVDDAVIPKIVEAMGSKDKATAKAAGRVLGNLGKKNPEKVLPSMLDILEKKQEPLTGYAVNVLRGMRGAAVPALPKLAALFDVADPDTKLDIIDALIAIDKKGDYAIPVLVKGLQATNPVDRKEALIGLIRYRNKADRFIEALVGALKDPQAENRFVAIGIVRGLGDQSSKVVPELINLTEDPEYRVRRAAISTLSAIKPLSPDVIPALEKALKNNKDYRTRSAAAEALGRLGKASPDRVIKILEGARHLEKDERIKKRIVLQLRRLERNRPATPPVGTGRSEK